MLFKKDNSETKKNDVELVLLKTATSNYELTMIQSILEDNSVPYILKDYETGGYMRIYMGTSFFNTDVFVSKNDFDIANDLIADIQ